MRITDRTVEVFHKAKRVAAHMRGSGNRRHTTVAEHMPSSHRRYANWTPKRIRSRAAASGPHTGILINVILRAKPHPEQGFRSCIGILRLAKTHGGERLEAACERALEIGATSYSSLASILKNNLERHHRDRPRTDRRSITPTSAARTTSINWTSTEETSCCNIPPSTNSRHLKLHGMARAFAGLNDNPQAGELDHGQWLALLLDREDEPDRDLLPWPRPWITMRWDGFARFLDDGRICITNNAAERALRGIALGRKSWLFCGSDRGGERAAAMYTLIGTAKLNDVDPQAWLADVLARIAEKPQTRLHELLPWHWKTDRQQVVPEVGRHAPGASISQGGRSCQWIKTKAPPRD